MTRPETFLLGIARAALLMSLTLVLTGASTSYGETEYHSAGFDPDDIRRGTNADIRSTTRKVRTVSSGRRWLVITVRAYERLGPEWNVTVHVDSRAGRRQDGTITFVKRKGDRIYCGLHFFVEDTWTVAGRQLGERAMCATRLNEIRPTKRIRWWIRSPVVGVGGPIDRAPDSGWYD